MPTKLLQVSDCHLARDPGADYRGQNADANLDRLMEPAKRWAPDLLVLTGDLSEDASVESYCRIRDWARRIECPVAWIPGNHDDRDLMAPVFDDAGFDSGPVIEAGAWQLALLDSAWPGDPGGELDEARLKALDRRTRRQSSCRGSSFTISRSRSARPGSTRWACDRPSGSGPGCESCP